MKDIKQDIILWAKNEGFLDCRFSKAEPFYKEAKNLEEWLKKGYHGDMTYMENNFDKRVDIGKLVDGASTVVSLSFNYFPSHEYSQRKL